MGKLLFLILCMLFGSMAALSAQEAAKVDRYAFVVGNKDYEQVRDLRNTSNDAHSVSTKLKSFGFLTETHIDQSAATFDDSIDLLMEKATISREKGHRVDIVFYFAGHGLSESGNNFLLPSDFPAELPGARGMNRHAILLTSLITSLSSVSDRLVMILDACRDDPFNSDAINSSNPDRRIFAGMSEIRLVPIGTQVLYCAGIKQTAKDFLPTDNPLEHNNGVCTRFLLLEMGKDNQSFSQMANNVQTHVYEATVAHYDPPQTPGIYDQMVGNFYFSIDTEAEKSFQKIDETIEIAAALLEDDEEGSRSVLELSRSVSNAATFSSEAGLYGFKMDIFFRPDRLKEAQIFRNALLVEGASINLVPTDLSEVTQYPAGTNRLVRLLELTPREESIFGNLVSLSDKIGANTSSTADDKAIVTRLQRLRSGPIQMQLF